MSDDDYETDTIDTTMRVRLWEEMTDLWIGYCPLLDVLSQGTTRDEAFRAISEAVDLWIRHMQKRGLSVR